MTDNRSWVSGDWTNFGDGSPWCGQLWIKNATVDNDQDYAECIEVIPPSAVDRLADNQLWIWRGSIYMPLDNAGMVASALGTIGVTLSQATWIDKALAFNAYHGMDHDIYGGETLVQFGAQALGLSPHVEAMEMCEILHGNRDAQKYIAEEFLS